MQTLGTFTALVALAFATVAQAGVLSDGDFYNWQYSGTGTVTVQRLGGGGNPAARIAVTTVSGPTVYGIALETSFATYASVEGKPYTLTLDVLSGDGAYGEGQGISLVVLQNGVVYNQYLGITGYPLNWDTRSFPGAFVSDDFSILLGSGAEHPDFSGGTETSFGFAASNSLSGTLTQYYDNFTLTSAALPVPEPATFAFLSTGLLVISLATRLRPARNLNSSDGRDRSAVRLTV